MNKITENIYLGGYDDANVDPRELKAMNISAVLNVGYELHDDYEYGSGIKAIKIGLTDDMDNSMVMKRLAIDTLKTLMNNNEIILVHCAMGISRSAYVVTCAIAEMRGISYHDAFDIVNKERPETIYGPLFANL